MNISRRKGYSFLQSIRGNTEISILLLIGCGATKEICFNQLEAIPRSGWRQVISMEFLQSFLRHHFAGRLVVASRNIRAIYTRKNKTRLT